MCAREDHDHDHPEPAPSPSRSTIFSRVALIAVWAAALSTTTLYLSALVNYGPADPIGEHFRTAAATFLVIATFVTCWYSNRRRAERLEAKRAAAVPDYEKGWEDGDRNGVLRTLDRLRSWLPADVFVSLRNGRDHHHVN